MPPAGAQTIQISPSLNYDLSPPVGIPDLEFVNYGRNTKHSFGTFDQYLLGKKSWMLGLAGEPWGGQNDSPDTSISKDLVVHLFDLCVASGLN